MTIFVSNLPVLFFFLRPRPTPTPTLFPYTTLFRSDGSYGEVGNKALKKDEKNTVRIEFINDNYRLTVNNDEVRSEEHTSELQSRFDLVCRLLLETKR